MHCLFLISLGAKGRMQPYKLQYFYMTRHNQTETTTFFQGQPWADRFYFRTSFTYCTVNDTPDMNEVVYKSQMAFNTWCFSMTGFGE